MKLNIWAEVEKVAFKAEANVITVEEADVAAEEDCILDMDE